MPGGFLKKDDIAVKVETADYENLLQLRRSELLEAESALQLEMGRQTIAQRDLALFETEITPENATLILRKPQLAAARSRVDAATAALNQAQLDLDRTQIEVPFDAQLISPLLVGEYLEVSIQGKPLENVVRLKRRYLRQNNTTWVMDAEGKLQIRILDIVFQNADYAYVRSGLSDADAVVTTNPASIIEGATLHRKDG